MKKILFMLVLCGTSAAHAQMLVGNQPTGNLQVDLVYGFATEAPAYQDMVKKKSIPLAIGLSAVVPGAGQAYNGDWLKAGIAVAVEAAAWYGYATWRADGLAGERAFQAEAHRNWSPIRYAEFLNGFYGYTGPEIVIPTGLTDAILQNPEAWSSAQQADVHDLISQIQGVEDQSVYGTGAAFSHKLPFFGEQQYYELIGKYFQYAPGWSDYTGNDVNEADASGRFWQYAQDHAHANDLLRRASRMTVVFFLTRFISVLDAALSAKRFNQYIETAVDFRPTAQGEILPMAHLKIRF